MDAFALPAFLATFFLDDSLPPSRSDSEGVLSLHFFFLFLTFFSFFDFFSFLALFSAFLSFFALLLFILFSYSACNFLSFFSCFFAFFLFFCLTSSPSDRSSSLTGFSPFILSPSSDSLDDAVSFFLSNFSALTSCPIALQSLMLLRSCP